jgi:hypothetical protein
VREEGGPCDDCGKIHAIAIAFASQNLRGRRGGTSPINQKCFAGLAESLLNAVGWRLRKLSDYPVSRIKQKTHGIMSMRFLISFAQMER